MATFSCEMVYTVAYRPNLNHVTLSCLNPTNTKSFFFSYLLRWCLAIQEFMHGLDREINKFYSVKLLCNSKSCDIIMFQMYAVCKQLIRPGIVFLALGVPLTHECALFFVQINSFAF